MQSSLIPVSHIFKPNVFKWYTNTHCDIWQCDIWHNISKKLLKTDTPPKFNSSPLKNGGKGRPSFPIWGELLNFGRVHGRNISIRHTCLEPALNQRFHSFGILASPCRWSLSTSRDFSKQIRHFGGGNAMDLKRHDERLTGWVVVSSIFYFHPYLGKIPIWLLFFKGVETTNQLSNEKRAPCWLGYIYGILGWNATQLHRDFFKSQYKDPK